MDEFVSLLIDIFGAENVEEIKPNALEQTIPDMLSSDYKRRFKAEYRQLLIRYQRLCSHIRKIESGKAKHDCSLDMLKQQRVIMRNYLDLLIQRSGIEGVDLVG